MTSEVKALHLKKCLFRGSEGLIYIQNGLFYVLQNLHNGAKPDGNNWKIYGYHYSYIFTTISKMEDIKTQSYFTLIENPKQKIYELW